MVVCVCACERITIIWTYIIKTSTQVACICCRTKIQLANEIDDYTKKLLEDYEDLDKLTIQADIWHSKYKASRSVKMYSNNHNTHTQPF